MRFGVVRPRGIQIVVGMIHGHKKTLNAEAKTDVCIVPVEAPLQDRIYSLPVLLNPAVGSAVRFFVPLELVNGTNTGLDVSKFSVGFDFGEVAGVSAFGKDKAKQQ